MKRYGALIIVAGVLIVTVIAGAVLLKLRANRDDDSDSGAQNRASLQSVILLEEFGDYQCPPCAQLHPSLKELKKQYGPKLNLVFRNLPLSTIHQNALPAAQAAEAARMQYRFWEMHDLLYENQSLWAEDKNPRNHFRKFATDLGLDMARFDADMDGDQVRFRLEADRDAAVRQGIDGTPTILIEGRKLQPEATTPEGIRKGIEVVFGGRKVEGSMQ